MVRLQTIGDKIIRAFRSGAVSGDSAGVKEIMRVIPGGDNRPSVSKECRYLAALGILRDESIANGNHGRRYVFYPTKLLADSGELAPSTATMKRLLAVPMTFKDLRYAMRLACGTRVHRDRVLELVEELLKSGAVVREPGASVQYARFALAKNGGGNALAAVAQAWARMTRKEGAPGDPLPGGTPPPAP